MVEIFTGAPEAQAEMNLLAWNVLISSLEVFFAWDEQKDI